VTSQQNYNQPIKNRACEYLTEKWSEPSRSIQIYIIGCSLDRPMRLAPENTGIEVLEDDGTIATKTWQHLENAYHTGSNI